MEELIKLLCEFSENGKIIDKNYLLLFFNNLANGIGLHGCTLTFANFFNSLFSTDGGTYDYFCDTITLYYNKLKIPKLRFYDKKNWEKFEMHLFRNLFVLDPLLHETTHAKEYRCCAEGGEDIETKLLLASCSYKLIEEYIASVITICNEQSEAKLKSKDEINAKSKEFLFRISIIQKPYIVDPSERIAEMGAKLSIIEIVNQIDKEMPHLISLLKSFLYFAYLDAYNLANENNLGPSFEYLQKTGNIELWQSFDFYDSNRTTLIRKVTSSYSLEDRLYLGLPVIGKEKEDIVKLVHSKFKGVSD